MSFVKGDKIVLKDYNIHKYGFTESQKEFLFYGSKSQDIFAKDFWTIENKPPKRMIFTIFDVKWEGKVEKLDIGYRSTFLGSIFYFPSFIFKLYEKDKLEEIIEKNGIKKFNDKSPLSFKKQDTEYKFYNYGNLLCKIFYFHDLELHKVVYDQAYMEKEQIFQDFEDALESIISESKNLVYQVGVHVIARKKPAIIFNMSMFEIRGLIGVKFDEKDRTHFIDHSNIKIDTFRNVSENRYTKSFSSFMN